MGKLEGDGMDPISLDVNYQWSAGRTLLETMIQQEATTARVLERSYDGYVLQYLSHPYKVQVQTPTQHKFSRFMPTVAQADTSASVLAPMPGKVVQVQVKAGDQVEAGQPLLVLEAMKMQNVIHADRAGVVQEIQLRPGDE